MSDTIFEEDEAEDMCDDKGSNDGPSRSSLMVRRSSSTEIVDNVSTAESLENLDNEPDQDEQRDVKSSTLLEIIDDKNRTISTLRKQLNGQYIQLRFYLNRELNNANVRRFSEQRQMKLSPNIQLKYYVNAQCLPDVVVDNIKVNLAMAKFHRANGSCSKLMEVYNSLRATEARVHNTLMRQEFLLKKASISLVELTRQMRGEEVRLEGGQLSTEVELFNTLLNITYLLKKELETFRIFAERLIVIEEERNSLVEQIYSLPTDQRYNCDKLLAMQNEKRRLEDEIDNVQMQHEKLLDRVNRVKTIQDGLRKMDDVNSQLELDIPGTIDSKFKGFKMNKMLKLVEDEAISLLTLTKDQKGKYTCELMRLKEENANLIKKLKVAEIAAREKDEMEAKVIALESKCVAIEKKVEDARKDLELEESERDSEFSDMRLELQTAIEENKLLKTKLKTNQLGEKEIQSLRFKAKESDELRRERDSLKIQVEDLKAIRNAYSSLLEHFPQTEISPNKEHLQELRGKISEAEAADRERDKVYQETKELSDAVEVQEKQIEHLLVIISRLGEAGDNILHRPTSYSSNEIELNSQELNSTNIDDKLIDVSDSEQESSQDKKRVMSESVDKDDDDDNDDDDRNTTSAAIENDEGDSEKDSHPVSPVDEEWETSNFHKLFDRREEETRSQVKLATNKSSKLPMRKGGGSKMLNRSSFSPLAGENSLLSTAVLSVESVDKNGQTESLRAHLESSSSVEGVLHLGTNTKLSLTLKCRPVKSGTPFTQCSSQYSIEHGEQKRDSAETELPYCQSVTDKRNKAVLVNSQLELIRAELDQALNRPEGKMSVLKSLKAIYERYYKKQQNAADH